MTWSEIKTVFQTLYPQYIGEGTIIDDSNGDDNTPSSLAVIINLVHNRITSLPLDFECTKQTSTLTLTGAPTYNLKTLLPGFRSLYQLYGRQPNTAEEFLPNYEANVIPIQGYSLRNGILYFSGNMPTSGELQVQYKTSYLVLNAAGDRQRYFLKDDDESALDGADINALIYGIGEFIQWKSDSASQDRKNEIKSWFAEAMNSMTLYNPNSQQVTSML